MNRILPSAARALLVRCLLFLHSTGNSQVAEPQAELSSHDTPATFKARVNLVLVPVVVRDSQGRAVGNLQKEDFQLFDKGKLQEIAKFSVEKSGGRAAQPAQKADAAVSEEQKSPALAPPERYIAYLFDDVHLKFSDLARVRDAAIHHLKSLEPTSRAGIFTTSGRTTLDFTDDRGKLDETLLRLRPQPVTGSGINDCPYVSYYIADLIENKHDQMALGAVTAEVIACEHLDPNRDRMTAQQQASAAASRELMAGDTESRLALGVIKDVVRRLSAMPGQRAIVLVSPGFFTPFDLKPSETEIMERATRSNVIISALDARGLYVVVPGGDASQANSDLVSVNVRALYDSQGASVDADVLAELADGTGGSFFQNSNDLEGGLGRVAAAPEYLYTLGFSPQNLKLDGSFHKLKVALREPAKLTLQARRGYYAPRQVADPAETTRREIEDAVFSREEMHDIPVELHTQFFKSSEDSARVAVLARVDVRQLRFRKEEGRNRNDLRIVSALFDRNGNYITGMDKLIEMRLRDETLEKKLQSGITVRTNFDVKPGAYLVRLVVRDTEGQLMSAQNGAVEIP